jgi:hypothetical protein
LLIVASAAWASADSVTWGWLVPILFVFTTLSMEFAKRKFTNQLVTITEVAPFVKYSLGFRWLACFLAITQTLMYTYFAKNDWDKMIHEIGKQLPSDFFKYWVFAFIASILYALSGLMWFFVLCQCGHRYSKGGTKQKTILLRLAAHDIIMGWIWAVLSTTFHDVLDDNDDKQWRALFCSMIMFHVILMLLELFNNKEYKFPSLDGKKPFFSSETRAALMMAGRFVLYSLVYYTMLNRLHTYDDMIVTMRFVGHDEICIYFASGGVIILNIVDVVFQKKTEQLHPKKTSYDNPSYLPHEKGRGLNF